MVRPVSVNETKGKFARTQCLSGIIVIVIIIIVNNNIVKHLMKPSFVVPKYYSSEQLLACLLPSDEVSHRAPPRFADDDVAL